MAYHCRACGFTKVSRFPNGSCPACRSFDIYSDQSSDAVTTKPKPYGLIVLVILLGLIAWALYEKISQ